MRCRLKLGGPDQAVQARYSLSQTEKSSLSRLAKAITVWSRVLGRHFPWREQDAGAYHKIVAEVLLQRTRAETVGSFYDAFFARYPDWRSLANASVDELEGVLRPIGLWKRRAASLRALAEFAVERDGVFPRSRRLHAQIPAVGQYVSNAIALFQHGKRRPLLDVNMARVIERYIHPRKLVDIRYDPWLQEASAWLVKRGDPVEINWAILDFGALICRARSPLCPECPLHRNCHYFASKVKHGSHRGTVGGG